MKNSIKILSIIGFLLLPQLVRSDAITDNYATGDTLTATTLNNIKSAVNDNDARISDNEARITALEAAPKANIAVTPPTPNDDINSGYTEGSTWIIPVTQQAYILVDSTAGSAVWKRITPTYSVGQRGPAGGIVFVAFSSGLEGYEAALVDQGSAEWGCFGVPIEGADGTDDFSSIANTADILAGCPTPGIAARLADDYSLNGFDDWFLPSKDLLNFLYLQRDTVGGLNSGAYWSSSEVDAFTAWQQNFGDGTQSEGNKDQVIGVRAVRFFSSIP